MGGQAETRRFHVLGGLRLEVSHVPLAGRAAQKKRLAALAVLAASYPRGVSREALGTMFWPEADPERSRRRVSATLYELRQALGPVVVESGEELRYDPAVLPCDIVDLELALSRNDPATSRSAGGSGIPLPYEPARIHPLPTGPARGGASCRSHPGREVP